MHLAYFENERLNNVLINNVLAARVELLQVSEVVGDFETVTPLNIGVGRF